MARPIRKNADYFPHENDMRHDSKVNALRRKHGNEGYAFYCFFLETITEASNFRVKLQTEIEWEILAADFMAERSEVEEALDYMVKLNLLQFEDGILTCSQLEERLQPLINQRKAKREYAERRKREKSQSVKQEPKSEQSPTEETDQIIIRKILSASRQVKESWVLKYKIPEGEFKEIAETFAPWWISKNGEGLSDEDIHRLAENTGAKILQMKFASSFLANEQKRRATSSTNNQKQNGKSVNDLLGDPTSWTS